MFMYAFLLPAWWLMPAMSDGSIISVHLVVHRNSINEREGARQREMDRGRKDRKEGSHPVSGTLVMQVQVCISRTVR